MAGRAKVSLLAGERQQIFMVAIVALHSGKAFVEVTAIKIVIYDVCHIWTPISVTFLVP